MKSGAGRREKVAGRTRRARDGQTDVLKSIAQRDGGGERVQEAREMTMLMEGDITEIDGDGGRRMELRCVVVVGGRSAGWQVGWTIIIEGGWRIEVRLEGRAQRQAQQA